MGIQSINSYLISKNFHKNYLDYLYFKEINITKEKKWSILKKFEYLFIPKVSIIIPVFNIENSIIKCLGSILRFKF